jgi:hypothetical protein
MGLPASTPWEAFVFEWFEIGFVFTTRPKKLK